MNRITDVTRQDLFDVIRDGFFVEYEEPYFTNLQWETGYEVKMPFCGRLTELEFLSRIYDLTHMPSHDSRYDNAEGDIWQHTINNDDWDSFWFFTDSRFKLSNGNDDKYILKFISEMLHPAVRDEHSQWKEYLKKFNEILHPDGYQLIATKTISGREAYEARELDYIEITHSSEKMYVNMQALGEGSYAKVFRFTDSFYEKDFVLKRAKPNLTEKELTRFKREYEQMRSLKSPYIVEVYSFDEDKHEYTMELMDFTLDKFISRNNTTLSIESRKAIISQLIKAYKYLHSKGVYHRDISPKNVLLKQYEDVLVVKISDFGLVKIVDSDLTSENTELKGSLNDPSLKVDGFASYGLVHELYALTLLFAFILTGKINWSNIKDSNVRAFMDKGTDSDKTKRYQSLDELGKAIYICIEKMKL